MEYRPRQKVALPVLETAKLIEDPARRLRALAVDGSPACEFVWRLLSSVLVYAARRVPEIADDVVNIDRAMRWGYAWDLGPFETWDMVGVEEIAKRLDAEDRPVPPIVRAVLERGEQRFYRSTESRREYFDLAAARYRPVEESAGVLVLASVKSANRVIAANPGASLIDLGDGIACLEFHSKLNTIGEDTIRMIAGSLEELQRHFDGLLIGNQSRDFSAGANLMLILLEAQDGNWDELDQVIREFQRVNLALRYSARPVVAAPFGRVGDRGLAAIEAYLYLMRTAGSISEYDTVVGGKLAHVMCGGHVPYGTTVTEGYLHDLEREAFLSLAGQPKTQERMRYILQTGKPLRN